ncbi:nucleotide disphospho-sugar-binding domain-containing protein [Enemella evansiae]|nr:nucleotide disphospho-sugar-binding domain-containing protein [Enemella evansiae]
MSAPLFVATMPAAGHVNPLLPVLTRLVRSGTPVVAAGTEEFADALCATGAEFVGYPPGVLGSADIAAATRSGGSVAVIVKILTATGEFAPFVAEQARSCGAAAVLHDSNALWGRIGAALTGLPTVSFMTTILIGSGAVKALSVREALAETGPTLRNLPAAIRARRTLVRTFGADLVPATPMLPLRGDLTIFPVPRTLQGPDARLDDSCMFVGPTADPGSTDDLDPELAAFLDTDQPVVLVSLGTLHAAGDDFFATCVDGLGDLPIRVVIATGRDTPPAAAAGAPSSFCWRTRVPQRAVLARSAAFVTHGGMNSALEGIAAGVPLVVIPQQVEQFLIGKAFADRGAATVLRQHLGRRPVPADQLRAAVRQAVTDPAMARAAIELGGTMRAEGGADRAAELINEFLAERVRR